MEVSICVCGQPLEIFADSKMTHRGTITNRVHAILFQALDPQVRIRLDRLLVELLGSRG